MTKKRSATGDLATDCFKKTPLAAAVMYAVTPGSAVAQEDDGLEIEEILVTATKREMSIQDVAQSITAFSTADIERRGIQDMADVATNLPSISLATTRAGRNEYVYRGISAGTSWRLDSQVAMYLDEMPMTIATTQLDPRMVDIARVESLPGPQGTLFGSSSQAGTLRVITNKPRMDEYAGEISAEIKSTKDGEESWDINGHLNVPVSDNFALRFVGYANKEGGYIDNVLMTAPHSVCAPGAPCDHDFAAWGGEDQDGHLNSATPDNSDVVEDDYNDYEMVGGRIAALWQMNDRWSLLSTFMMQHSETTGDWRSDTGIGDYKVARFSEEWRKDEWWMAALQFEGDLGFARFTNSFGYSKRDQSYQFDNTHYEAYHTRLKGQYWSVYANYWANYYYAYYGTPIPQYNYYDKYDTGYNGGIYRSIQEATRISNEIRLTSTTDSKLQWMVGAFFEDHEDGWDDNGDIPNLGQTKHWRYTQWRSCDLNDQGFDTPCLSGAPSSDSWYNDVYDRDIQQIAAFSEIDYNFTDNFKLTAGLRWFQYDRLTINDRQWPPGLPVEAILLDGEAASIEEGKEQDTALKLGVSWNVTDDAMIYALYSEGFRLGGNNNPKAVRVNFVPRTYDPDKLNNHEIGLKSEWLDNRLQLNATLFYMTWDDIQLSFSSEGSGLWWLRGQDNGGGGRNLGFEADIDWRVTENLQLEASIYQGDAYYTDDYITQEDERYMTAGTQMIESANEKVTLGVDYTFRNVRGGDLWVRYDTQYEGPKWSALWRAEEANSNSPDFVEGAKEDVDSFTKGNLFFGYERQTWSATLAIRNVTNERANTFTSNGASGYAEYWGHTGFGEAHNLARPRTVSLRYSKRF